MSDEELVKLLKAIQAMVLVPYPFKTVEANDARLHLVMALGEIHGRAAKALADFGEAK